MGKCERCGVTVIGGGVNAHGHIFCSDTCFRVVSVKELSQSMPEGEFSARVELFRQSNCPKCGGSGPIEIHSSHKVLSAIVMSQVSSRPQLSCTRCARIEQVAGIVVSAALGWWGFIGLIMTPIQIGRNLMAIIRPSGRKSPSLNLRWLVAGQIRKEMAVAASLAEQERRAMTGDSDGWRRPQFG